MRLLVATSNEGKVREIRRLLAQSGESEDNVGGARWEILSMADLACLWKRETLGGLLPAEGGVGTIEEAVRGRYAALAQRMAETGSTFEENAVIKARGAAEYTGLLTLADDSGLEVDRLKGAPGVYSARYAGPSGDEQACNDLLLANLTGVPDEARTARYRAVLALASADGDLYLSRGTCEGRIGFTPKGSGGFGYDPLFILPGSGMTMAELTMEEKNKISHRGKALSRMLPVLAEILGRKALTNAELR
ncbi:MAG: RdgB/HAM1 family non-canonical purine NTP pyrophosphatase [Clostridiales bacterium]|jgi:XTP/dITP diphosphohydrolase|nr:RdgB/HAM1 family non-canonical purine NTP pyrophosphatase [Clostridiales bacterium]